MTNDAHAGDPSCPQNPQAVGWVLHALEPDEELEMRAHLERCRSCRDVVRESELLVGAVGAGVESVAPPPHLRDRLLAAAAQTPQEHRPGGAGEPDAPRTGGGAVTRARPRTPPPATGRPGPRRGRQLVAAGVVAAALAGLGTLTGYTVQLRAQRDAESTQVHQLADIIVRSRQPGSVNTTLSADGRPVASVMVVDGRSTVVTSGLTPNASTTTYVLWGIVGAGPVALGTFDVTDAGAATRWTGVVPARFAGYAISLEPGRTAPSSPTDVVAKGLAE